MNRAAHTLVLVLATLIVHGRIVANEFVDWDDTGTIAGNPRMLQPSLEGVGWYWTHPTGGLYVPLTYTAWAFIATVARVTTPGGAAELNPALFHMASLLLHLGSVLLVRDILRRLLANDLQALVGALLFSLHPMQVETLAWASGLKDVLCGFLSLAAIRSYILFVQSQKRSQYAASIVLLVLAMLAKPAALVVPLMIGLIDWLILARPWRTVLRSTLPLLLAVVPLAVVARVVQNSYPQTDTPLWTRPLIAADALAFYAKKILVPHPVTVIYGRTPAAVLSSGQLYFTWLLPAGIVLTLWLAGKRSERVAVGVALFAVALLPVLGLTRFSMQVHSTVSDHYVYLPMFGLAIAVAGLATRPSSIVPIGIFLVIAGALSFQQAGHWRSSLTLFSHAVQVLPDNEDTQLGLGHALAQVGRGNEAIAHFQKAVEVNPTSRTARELLTQALIFGGQYESAIPHGLVALQLAASEPQADSSQINFLLGRAYAQLGQYSESAGYLAEAARQQPNDRNLAAELQSVREKQSQPPATQR